MEEQYLTLKRPATPSPTLERAMRNVIAQLSTVSHVRAARVQADIAHLKPEGSPPSGEPFEVCAYYRAKFNRCESDWKRLEVIGEAQRFLSQMRYAPDRAFIRGTLSWKLAIARDQRVSVEVACTYGVSSSYVRKLRATMKTSGTR